MTEVEKAATFLRGLAGGDAALAIRHVGPGYVEHDPMIGDGVEGVARAVAELAPTHPELRVVRRLRDGDHVVLQSDGRIGEYGTFFDVFRFEGGLIAEHWGFAAPSGPPNGSGHTQIDGPTEPAHEVDAAASKALVRDYYETVHIQGRHGEMDRFFGDKVQVRHEPGVSDGVDAFRRDLEVLTRDRTIDEIRLLLGQGDFVFLVALGTHAGSPCAYVDLYRVEDGKLVEHWGFPQAIAGSRNGNGVA